ncbi:hypothetical protein EHQ13_08815 [Leptospira gomenensis]|uniref:Uncharacterized protein n=2 Tax=Leptospira gomenensis TaxID=2484974 RepID=A0A5F1YV85_9LEPT|nr:hypothetical protein [Leptospira gomenensis]TGK31775.1 hypothetical protein EHQ17_13425 [Leptospira gomenensis]TGK61443.1 hypothetical protein EHQ13_08815 [Leptospira gomenensis]
MFQNPVARGLRNRILFLFRVATFTYPTFETSRKRYAPVLPAKYAFLVLTTFVFPLAADTILLKDRSAVIGKVIEYKKNGILISTPDGISELRSDQIYNIEIGFNGIPTKIKTTEHPEENECIFLGTDSKKRFIYYDEKSSELRSVELQNLLSAEHGFPPAKKKYKNVFVEYPVQIFLKDGTTKSGILSEIDAQKTTFLENGARTKIPNSKIVKVQYQNRNEPETQPAETPTRIWDQTDELRPRSPRAKLYEYFVPGSYQIRTGRKKMGVSLLASTVVAALGAEYEYERGKKELHKQKAYNEKCILLGGDYGLIQADFSYEAYYQHKNNNRSLLILTSLFYVFNFLDLWFLNSFLANRNESAFSVIPTFRFPLGTTNRVYPNSETAAQIRFQLRF